MENGQMYDAAIIYEHSGRMLKRARSLESTYIALGLVLGALMGGASAKLFGEVGLSTTLYVLAATGALLGGLWGRSAGYERAMLLRVQAQTALCQVRIEENTRPREGSVTRTAHAA